MAGNPTLLGSNNGKGGANGFLEFEKPLLPLHQEMERLTREQGEDARIRRAELRKCQARLQTATKRLYAKLTAWETVLVARHPHRPLVTDYIRMIVDDFCELHGDRAYGDDRAIVTGFGRIARQKVMVVGHNKGKDTRERIACNFGCAHPEGYRKALQKMRLAAKYGLPVVCFIDTQGAYPGVGSEERGVAQAIAVNLMEMTRLPTPVCCVVIGEGGSGGALGIGVGDRVAMLEHAFYSVISPEGCAAILFKTAEQRQLAAESLKLTAKELKKLRIVDDVIAEPVGGAHRDPAATAAALQTYLGDTLRELRRCRIDTLLKRRYERIRNTGSFFQSVEAVAARKAKARRTARRKPRSTASRKRAETAETPAETAGHTA